MKKDNTNKKSSLILKILKIICVCIIVLAITVFGLYKLVTHQWQDEPKEYAATNEYITQLGDSMVIAHRAGKKLFPQGTMMAFEGCVNSESFETDIFEFDVRLTADEKLIIVHDDTLDEVSDAIEHFGKTENYPEDYTYEEISELNFGEFFKNESGEMPYNGLRGKDIPDNLKAVTVMQALTYLENNGNYRYSIEIKNSGELGVKAVDALYDTLSVMKLIDKVIVTSFNSDVILYIEQNHPELIRAAYNVEVALLFLDSLFGFDREERHYSFDVIQVPPDKYIVNLGTSKLVNYAHKNDIAVQYWTINDAERMKFLRDIGADGIITDVPDVAYDVLKSK